MLHLYFVNSSYANVYLFTTVKVKRFLTNDERLTELKFQLTI
jgi:hypothetical protein